MILTEITNYLLISPGIASSGQPTRQQFADIRAAGYQVIVNLAVPTSTNALVDEASLVEAQGMLYVHIPVLWEKPRLENLTRFFEVMQQYQENKVFVHCALNMRASAFLFLYRNLRLSVPLDEARAEMLKIWDPDENENWKGFIETALQKLDKDAFDFAAACYGFNIPGLKFLSGGHSGTPVFQFKKDDRECVLRVSLNEPDLNRILGMFEWMDYLSLNNAPVPAVIKSVNNRLVETFEKGGNRYIISVVTKAQGILAEELSVDQWTNSLFENIGRAAGKIHGLAKQYRPSSIAITRPQWQQQFQEYYSGALLAGTEQVVRKRLTETLLEVESFPKDLDSYGLIHADLHFANFYVDGDHATIFDFEDCCYGWFAMDAAMALFDILVLYPGNDLQKLAERFTTHYLHGYLKENNLSLEWARRLLVFLKLQEIFIYSMVYQFTHLDEWSTKFLANRKSRIENEIPYIDIDFGKIYREALKR